MNWLSNIKLPIKFLILGVLVCISIAIPTKFFYDSEKSLIEISEQEESGIDPIDELILLVKKIQEHRGMSAIYLGDTQTDSAGIAKKTDEVQIEFAKSNKLFSSGYPMTKVSGLLKEMSDQFDKLALQVQSRMLTGEESFGVHTQLVLEVLGNLIPSIMQHSQLSYDPVASSYHLVIASFHDVPLILEGLGRMRGQGSGVLSKGRVTETDKAKLSSTLAFIEMPLRELESNLHAAAASTDNPDVEALLNDGLKYAREVEGLSRLLQREILDRSVTHYDPQKFFNDTSVVINEFFEFAIRNSQVLHSVMKDRIAHANESLTFSLVVILSIVVLLVIICILIVRNINASLKDVHTSANVIASGDFSVDLNVARKDEFASINQALMHMAKSLKEAKEESERTQIEIKARLVETTRIEEALNATTTNVMISNMEHNIIYLNRSIMEMLGESEKALRKTWPHFSVDKILGESLDHLELFDEDSAQQRSLLENLKSTYKTQIEVGGLHFRLIANPIYSQSGDRIGSIIEWLNRTAEVEAEEEIGNIVQQASKGNFSLRTKVENKTGFLKFMSESLNQLVETADYGLTDVSRVLMSLSQGNLTEKIVADYEGQFDDLKRYCNQTTENLTSMISEIRNAAETINLASSEIAQGNADLSNRTESQASNLEETASSMEEITSTVRLNADNANQANLLASEASGVASEGGRLIAKVVETMASINESSQKIADIIGVIDGIAFQTNILALNAAVEAARAGEQGRGFAVVASEVRTLAQRSANAAKDIKALISDSVSKIEDGNSLVGQSGQTMDKIVDAITRVNGIMSEIAAASAEQASGVDEINKAISQMDEMTQQNAALVEEAAASAESMRNQANQLEERVSSFILDENDHVPTQPVAVLEHSQSKKKETHAVEHKPAGNTLASTKKAPASKPKPAPSAPSVSVSNAKIKTPKPSIELDDEWEEF